MVGKWVLMLALLSGLPALLAGAGLCGVISLLASRVAGDGLGCCFLTCDTTPPFVRARAHVLVRMARPDADQRRRWLGALRVSWLTVVSHQANSSRPFLC